MNRLLVMVLLAVVAASAISLIGNNAHVHMTAQVWRPQVQTAAAQPIVRRDLSLPITKPVALDWRTGDSLRVTLSGLAFDYVTVLSVTADGPITITTQTGARDRSRTCGVPDASASERNTSETCKLTVRLLHNKPTIAIISARLAGARITNITYDVAAAKQHASASGHDLLYGFLFLLLLGPILVWLRRWPNLDRIALILLGFTWVGMTSLTGLAFDIAFALIGYGLFYWISVRRPGRLSSLLMAALGVVMVLVFIKFIAPMIGNAFANPGGFWLALPLGASYFAIRIIDLLLSGYSSTQKPIHIRDYFAFLFMPHTLPAGPILTYREFLNCRIKNYGFVDFAAGSARMCIGITKKVFADAIILPQIFRIMLSFLEGGRGDTPLYIAVMLLANTVYIYLDFSAYCDLAIGTGRAAGYKIPENFDWPLLRSSLRRFWQHWHMTLTNWVMRRLYFPAFLSSRSILLSMLASMLVIGLWHAPTLSWAAWAFHHALAMSVEAKLFPVQSHKAISRGQTRYRTRLKRGATYAGGIIFVWYWVALGHSFTMFSSPSIAFECYSKMLTAPFELVHQIVGIVHWL